MKYLQNIFTAMHSLINDQGELITDQEEIKEEARKFYEKLYTKEKDISTEDQEFFLGQINKTLSEDQKQKLEEDLEMKDLQEALHDTQNENRQETMDSHMNSIKPFGI